jgi:hypothetical protein
MLAGARRMRLPAVRPDGRLGRSLLLLRNRARRLAWRPASEEESAQKAAVARVAPYTMVDVPRLRTLLRLTNLIVEEGVPGAIVECGCWRGGTLALIDWSLRRAGSPRSVYAVDSFEGLPPPGPHDGEEAHRTFVPGWCRGAAADLERAARSVGGSASGWTVVKGWFEDTIPRLDPGPIALLHIDADWFESVNVCLTHLHRRVSHGGFVVVDDYGRWPGCDRAVRGFLGSRVDELVRPTQYGAFWRVARPRACETEQPPGAA